MVEFEDVKSKAEEEPLNGDIAFSTSEKPSEMHVLFGHGKGTLRLDGAVDAQETALLGGDALFHFFPLTQEIFVDVEGLGSFLQGFLAGTFADTFVFAGAVLAVLAAVNGSFGQKARLCLLFFYLGLYQAFPLGTDILILVREIGHILSPPRVGAVFLFLLLLVIGGLDIGVGML